MTGRLKSAPFREIGKWCAYALVLLAPGSFFVLPAIWLARSGALRMRSRPALPSRRAGARTGAGPG